jgi:protein CMS1
MNRTGGDDLDDDFVPDDLVALSEDEAAHSADGEDIGALLSADEDHASPSTTQADVDKKRKRRAKEKERKAKVIMLYYGARYISLTRL